MPVTLFEVEDLWQEAKCLQHCGFPGPVPTSSWAGGSNTGQVDQSTPMQKSMQDSQSYTDPIMLLRFAGVRPLAAGFNNGLAWEG